MQSVPPDFGRSVNPISQPRGEGAYYAQHITTGHPGFSDIPMALTFTFLIETVILPFVGVF